MRTSLCLLLIVLGMACLHEGQASAGTHPSAAKPAKPAASHPDKGKAGGQFSGAKQTGFASGGNCSIHCSDGSLYQVYTFDCCSFCAWICQGRCDGTTADGLPQSCGGGS